MDIKRFPGSAIAAFLDIEPKIRSGDLLFASGNGTFSRMIRWATGGIWSHVAFMMRLESLGTVMVMESVESVGVRAVPLVKYLTDYDSQGNPYDGGLVVARHREVANLLEQPEKVESLARAAIDLLGYPYDTDEIAKMAGRIAVSSFLPDEWQKPHELERDREFICSEFVEECFKCLDVDLPHAGGYITPSDIAGIDEVELQAVLKRP